MPNPNNCLRYWDLADHIRIDDAIALWCGVEPAEPTSLNFETQCMSAKRVALVAALCTERLEYEDLGNVKRRFIAHPNAGLNCPRSRASCA